MKKTYQKPNFYIVNIDTTQSILAVSPGVDGNTGMTNGIGDTPEEARSRHFGSNDYNDEYSDSQNNSWY